MSSLLTELAGAAPAIGATVLLRGAAIVAAAALAARLLARASAATRYGVWALAFGALAAMPFAGPPLPRWTVTSPIVGPAVAHPAAHPVADPAILAPAGTALHEAAPPAAWAAPSGHRARALPGAAVLVWLLGTALLLARLAAHAFRAGGIARRGTVLPGHRAAGVRVVLSADTAVPLVCGVRRPAIVLPASAAAWSPEMLASVLAHEMAHVHRRDYLFHLGSRIVVACYWVNPLVWMAVRRLAAERERACDDRVVSGCPAHEYATHLVDVARLVRGGGAPAEAALAMAGRHALRERIHGLLAPDTDRRPLSRSRLLLLGLALATIAIPVAALQLRRPPAPDPHLFTALEDPHPGLRARAAWGLGEFESRTAVPALLQRLDDPDPTVRGAVAWALGEIKDARTVERLSQVLEADGDPLVREMAAVALGEIGAVTAVGSLTGAARREPALLPAVLWSLGEIRHKAAAAALRELRFGAPDVTPWIEGGTWRRAAERALRVGPAGGSGGVDAALASLTAPDALVRAGAAWALGRVGTMAAVDPLLGAMRDADIRVRALAVWALDEINPTRGNR